ncbi:MAG: ATP-binding protein [Bdellovibrionia bacterium]
MATQLIKIAITGGPSGGKTTLIEALKKELGPQCAVVPEAASILYKGGYPRSRSVVALMHTQKAIYYTQRELEAQIISDYDQRLVVCDRGSLDAEAYWPKESELSFFEAVNSTRNQELARYDWVLHLDTASQDFYDTSNPIRLESYHEAMDLNERIKKAWNGHPKRIVIGQNSDFLSKMMTSLAVIRAIMAHGEVDQVLKLAKA